MRVLSAVIACSGILVLAACSHDFGPNTFQRAYNAIPYGYRSEPQPDHPVQVVPPLRKTHRSEKPAEVLKPAPVEKPTELAKPAPVVKPVECPTVAPVEKKAEVKKTTPVKKTLKKKKKPAPKKDPGCK